MINGVKSVLACESKTSRTEHYETAVVTGAEVKGTEQSLIVQAGKTLILLPTRFKKTGRNVGFFCSHPNPLPLVGEGECELFLFYPQC